MFNPSERENQAVIAVQASTPSHLSSSEGYLEALEKSLDLGPRLRYMSRLDVFLFETGVSLGDTRSVTLTRSNLGWE
jgi:hypothetical protein